MEAAEYFQIEYLKLKQIVMEDYGFNDSDLDIDENEDKVMRKTDDLFEIKFGFEYNELID